MTFHDLSLTVTTPRSGAHERTFWDPSNPRSMPHSSTFTGAPPGCEEGKVTAFVPWVPAKDVCSLAYEWAGYEAHLRLTQNRRTEVRRRHGQLHRSLLCYSSSCVQHNEWLPVAPSTSLAPEDSFPIQLVTCANCMKACDGTYQ